MKHKFFTADKIILEKNSINNLDEEFEKLEPSKVLLISSNSVLNLGHLKKIIHYFEDKSINLEIIEGVNKEPTDQDIQSLRDNIEDDFDLVIGVGGGSVLDATKILSVLLTNSEPVRELIGNELVNNPGVPTILIPTTAGTGSEVTPNGIVTLPDKNLKEGIISRHLLPNLVVLDASLLSEVPKDVISATGIDAFTHAIESLISKKANPLSRIFSLESIRLINEGLTHFYKNPHDEYFAEKMLVGSMYGGMALTSAGTAAVHALAYPLGGTYDIPHGVANSMLLPHVMKYNYETIENELKNVANVMGLASSKEVISQIEKWTKELEIPQDLTKFGITNKDLNSLAVSASKVTRLLDNNPKELNIKDIESIYENLI